MSVDAAFSSFPALNYRPILSSRNGKNDENAAASVPDNLVTPYFFLTTITNIYSNNIALVRSLRAPSELPIFAADKRWQRADMAVL
jgi:hypothetical protein